MSSYAQANEERIAFLVGELCAYGAGWSTLMYREALAHREELSDQLVMAAAAGHGGQHKTGCVSCRVMRARASQNMGAQLIGACQ